MHVAVLFEYPTLHGGERSLLAAMDEWHRQSTAVRFTALAPADGPLMEALTARQIRHIAWSVRDYQGQRRPADHAEASLMDVLRSSLPDLVHANSLAMGRLLGKIARKHDVPTTSHLRDILGLSGAAIADLNRHAALIAVSHATRSFHVAQGLDAGKTVVIQNGIDLDAFQPRPATGFLHRELQLPSGSPLVVTIGQIGLRKGWNVLVNAVIPVAKQWLDVQFVFLGARHSDKPESRRYEADLRQRVCEASLERRVHWLGDRDDVPRILNEADLLVHPANEEPLGRVLLEGLASGVPMIATDVGGTPEIIEPEISGRLVPKGDSKELAAAMQSLLSDRALSDRFRQAARRRAETHFGIRSSAIALFHCWQTAVENRFAPETRIRH